MEGEGQLCRPRGQRRHGRGREDGSNEAGWDAERVTPEGWEWQGRQALQASSLQPRLQPRDYRGASSSCHQGQKAPGRRNGGLDDQPGGSGRWDGGRASSSAAGGSRKGTIIVSVPGKEGEGSERAKGKEKETKRERQERGKEKRWREEQEKQGVQERGEEERFRHSKRLLGGEFEEMAEDSRGSVRGYRPGYSRGKTPSYPEEGVQGGKEEEEEGELRHQLAEQQFRRRELRQRNDRRGPRAILSEQQSKEDLEEVPGCPDHVRGEIYEGAPFGFTRTAVGSKQDGDPPDFPPVLQGTTVLKDESRDEAGGFAPGLWPRPGPPREVCKPPGLDESAAQSPRGSECRQSLDCNIPNGTGSHGSDHSGNTRGDRGSGTRGPRSGQDQGQCIPSLRRSARGPKSLSRQGKGRKRQRRKGQRGQRQGEERLQRRWRSTGRCSVGRQEKEGMRAIKRAEAGTPRMGVSDSEWGKEYEREEWSNQLEAGYGPSRCFTEAEEGKSGPTLEYPAAKVFLQSLEGKRFSQLGDLIDVALMFLSSQFLRSKSQTSGRERVDIFPLPISGPIIDESPCGSLIRATCRALNVLYDCPPEGVKRVASAEGLRVLGYIRECVEFVDSWTESFGGLSFVFFKSKGVDYRGEEVKVAQSFSWESILPALPQEVGRLCLVDFCSQGTRHYVENFPSYLLPEPEQLLGKPPRVMVFEESWLDVCRGLVKRNICGVLPKRLLHHVKGRPLLSGLFAVGKNEFEGDMEIHRLIMNLIPLNNICKSMSGDIGTLPGVSGLTPFLLEKGEVLLLSSEDVRCFFYLFAVPQNWFP